MYRCESAGKVSYSDEPCIGAKVIEAIPTQGAHSLSGKKTSNAQLAEEERRKIIDKAMEELSGLTHEQMKVERRRSKLPLVEKLECATLDRLINDENQDELTLYQRRKRYFYLRC